MFIQKHCSLLFVALVFSLLFACQPSNNDYTRVFGESYSSAEKYLFENQWIYDSLIYYGVDPDLSVSIIFPELIRYSQIRNSIETFGLEVLYVQYGEKYANFSIGRFQMKPGFAERIEKDWILLSMSMDKGIYQINQLDTNNTSVSRKLRLERLKDEKWQVKYLAAFVKIMVFRFRLQENGIKTLKFLSSAYNYGYWKDERDIIRSGNECTFYTGYIKPDSCYCYKDISCYYFNRLKGVFCK